jgi:hypothetical protein
MKGIKGFLLMIILPAVIMVAAPLRAAEHNIEELAKLDQNPVANLRGVGKLFLIDSQFVNAQLQAFYNVEKPEPGANWSLRFQFELLFPR